MQKLQVNLFSNIGSCGLRLSLPSCGIHRWSAAQSILEKSTSVHVASIGSCRDQHMGVNPKMVGFPNKPMGFPTQNDQHLGCDNGGFAHQLRKQSYFFNAFQSACNYWRNMSERGASSWMMICTDWLMDVHNGSWYFMSLEKSLKKWWVNHGTSGVGIPEFEKKAPSGKAPEKAPTMETQQYVFFRYQNLKNSNPSFHSIRV